MLVALVTLLNHHNVSPLQVEDHHPPEDVTVASLPVPEELLELKDAVLVALCGLHTPDIAFGGELEADLIADDTWSQKRGFTNAWVALDPKKSNSF